MAVVFVQAELVQNCAFDCPAEREIRERTGWGGEGGRGEREVCYRCNAGLQGDDCLEGRRQAWKTLLPLSGIPVFRKRNHVSNGVQTISAWRMISSTINPTLEGGERGQREAGSKGKREKRREEGREGPRLQTII
jgi:hypothetical protein